MPTTGPAGPADPTPPAEPGAGGRPAAPAGPTGPSGATRYDRSAGPQRDLALPGPLPAEILPVDPDLPGVSPARAGRPREWDVIAVISVGGGLGSIARYGLARAWPTATDGFPWATFTANILGSLLLGLLMVYVIEVWPPARYRRPFVGVGFIGGFTTFSTYMSETRGLLAGHHFALADAYALTSLLAGLAAVWSGVALARVAVGKPVRRGPRRRAEAGRTATVPDSTTAPGTGAVPGTATAPDSGTDGSPASQEAGTR